MNRIVLPTVSLLALLTGCQALIGLEERELDPNAITKTGGNAVSGGAQNTGGDVETGGTQNTGGDAETGGTTEGRPPTEAECDTYCELLDGACTKANNSLVYPSTAYCRAICPHFKNGEAEKTNSFDCRLEQASLADEFKANPSEIQGNCFAAGTSSAGTCGGTCEAYCQLFSSVCNDGKEDERCEERCAKLIDRPQAGNIAFSGAETVQCRLAHLAAASADPNTHCPHAALAAAEGTPCLPKKPNCRDYCELITSTCTQESSQQYASVDACVHTCEGGMELGEAPDYTGDTVACRRYHIYNAVGLGDSHCDHGGAGGDGHCGTLCNSYCTMADKLCPSEFANTFGLAVGVLAQTSCRNQCATLIGKPNPADQADLGYSVNQGKTGGNTIQCRLYHLTESGTDANACLAAVGKGACAP